jgi:hypothetical protein
MAMIWITFFNLDMQITLGSGTTKQCQALGTVFKAQVLDMGATMIDLTVQDFPPTRQAHPRSATKWN